MTVPRIPPSGVWAPAVTLFNPETDDLLPEDQAKWYSYLSKTGLVGLVVLGTNAETFLLTREERKKLVELARQACGPDYPIMAGCGGHSTRQVLEFIADAADAGANYALVLPAAYFGKATTPAVIDSFFAEVAEKSPIPIVLYNFPGVCNGVDLDSDTITKLAQRHENIVGVKLTCGSVAKITRLSAVLPADKFATFGGQSDFLIGGLSSGSAGCIAAFGNVYPKTIVNIYNLYQAGKMAEALALHQKAAIAEQSVKSGISAVKYGAAIFSAKAAGIENAEEKLKPRRPYGEPDSALKEKVSKGLAELASIEQGL